MLLLLLLLLVVVSLSQDLRPLEDGDLVNVDVTLYLNGFHADTARSWICGNGDATGQRHLVKVKVKTWITWNCNIVT